MKPIHLPLPLLAPQPPAVAARPPAGDTPEAIQKAAEEFEALFIHMMMKAARQAGPDGGIVPRSNGEEFFTDLLDQELGKVAAGQGGLGIARQLVEQWKGTGSSHAHDPDHLP